MKDADALPAIADGKTMILTVAEWYKEVFEEAKEDKEKVNDNISNDHNNSACNNPNSETDTKYNFAKKAQRG